MSSCTFGSPNQRTEVVRIFDLVEYDNEGWLSFASCVAEYLADIDVLSRCDNRGNTLGGNIMTKLAEALLIELRQCDTLFPGELPNSLDGCSMHSKYQHDLLEVPP
jgi:hypothetical protein